MTTKKTAPVKSGASSTKKTSATKPAVTKSTSEKKESDDKQPPVIPGSSETPAEGNQSPPAPPVTEETPKLGSDELKVNIKSHQGPVVVIPFLANKAKGKELLYAIRAWEKHLPDVMIILVGDTLPELNEKVLHIPHKPMSDNPQIDVASKMAAAIASDLVPEVFVWSNDDIYCVSDIQPAELLLLKAMPGGLAAKGSSNGIYRENALRTLKALKAAGIEKPYDYATHTPVVFEKSKLADTLATYKCTKEGHLVSSLYFNTHFPKVKPVILDNSGRGSVVASVFRPNPNPQVMPTIFATQKWVNNNDPGWKAVEPYLVKMFPDKSAFEK